MDQENQCVIDLFCGPGGLSLGAARVGFKVIAGVDLDSTASETHKRNFPRTAHMIQDISELNGKRLLKAVGVRKGSVCGVIGGPPCQGFSTIGKRTAGDPRNSLFVEFFRVVSEIRPKFFLAENVPGIMYRQNKALRDKAFLYVEKHYEFLPHMIMVASQYGAPTNRTRVFFVGYRRNHMNPLSLADFTPPGNVEVVRVREALTGLTKKINPNWQTEAQGWRFARVHGKGFFSSRLQGHIPRGVGDPDAIRKLKKENRASGFLGTVHTPKVEKRYGELGPGDRDSISKSQRLDLAGFCPTLRAGTGSDRGSFQAVRPIHPTEARVITPREAARLQGFPDWYQFSATKWHSFRQIGSSVSPIVAERLLSVIRKAL